MINELHPRVGVAEATEKKGRGGLRRNALFFAGDLGQRIFQTPFSWRPLGVDVRGRSHTLRINYRTSHQIRRQADRLLPAELADVGGNRERRRGAISVFDGPEPRVELAPTIEAEAELVAAWLRDRLAGGLRPARDRHLRPFPAELRRAEQAAHRAGRASSRLDDRATTPIDTVAVGTMHLAKGLEFRAVAAMACDEDVLPLAARLESVADGADLEDVYETERHLLYVACTCARDQLLVAAVEPGSEYLADLTSESGTRNPQSASVQFTEAV